MKRALFAITLVACKNEAPSGPPVAVRFVHDLSNPRVRSDLRAAPQLTVRYVAVAGEYDRGKDAGAATFDTSRDGGARIAHDVRLSPGTYRVEACLEPRRMGLVPGGGGRGRSQGEEWSRDEALAGGRTEGRAQ